MEQIFTGAATALITPFDNDGNVDFSAFNEIVNWQIESGIDALVAASTTGESATLSDAEKLEVIATCIKTAHKRVPVIAGTGSNNTAHAVELTRKACELGTDAVLVVTPYYNKATQGGLIAHFNAVADASSVPVILYNVPSRTGVNIEPETLAELAKHDKIVAIKEASGNLEQVQKMHELCGDEITIYSGNDDQITTITKLGGKGVISVLSNLFPSETSKMVHLYLEGQVEEAEKLQQKYAELIKLLFCEVNPIPVKAAMAKVAKCGPTLRLPLTQMTEQNKKLLYSEMTKLDLIWAIQWK